MNLINYGDSLENYNPNKAIDYKIDISTLDSVVSNPDLVILEVPRYMSVPNEQYETAIVKVKTFGGFPTGPNWIVYRG